MPPTMVPPPTPRQQYEALLREVVDEVHRLLMPFATTALVDDSAVHELIQQLRDNFGPEVPR